MTRTSRFQRELLDLLIHMRVPPKDAWMSTQRLAQLTGRTPDRTRLTLRRMEQRSLVVNGEGSEMWSATETGRETFG